MKIAVDCRYMGRSGIGRVCQGIVDNLNFDDDKIYLVGDPKKLTAYTKAEIVEDLTDPYSIKGLLKFNKSRINRECDAIIIPNFLIPFGIHIPVYSVMHDLIFLDNRVSTNGFVDYQIKKILLKRGVKRSVSVACVSDFTRTRCEHYFKGLAKKCYANHIGLSQSVLEYVRPQALQKKKNTLIFVGNVKPHKGLKTLVQAFHALPQGEWELKIIGEKDNFAVKLDDESIDFSGVTFTGRLSDDQLLDEIASATYLVQPSQYEGFGLPPLEALYLGTKPIVSDIPVFNEVYKDFDVVHFKVDDSTDLCRAILSATPDVEDQKAEIQNRYSYQKFTQNILSKIKNGN